MLYVYVILYVLIKKDSKKTSAIYMSMRTKIEKEKACLYNMKIEKKECVSILSKLQYAVIVFQKFQYFFASNL